jgi:hypothetical protein
LDISYLINNSYNNLERSILKKILVETENKKKIFI